MRIIHRQEPPIAYVYVGKCDVCKSVIEYTEDEVSKLDKPEPHMHPIVAKGLCPVCNRSIIVPEPVELMLEDAESQAMSDWAWENREYLAKSWIATHGAKSWIDTHGGKNERLPRK